MTRRIALALMLAAALVAPAAADTPTVQIAGTPKLWRVLGFGDQPDVYVLFRTTARMPQHDGRFPIQVKLPDVTTRSGAVSTRNATTHCYSAHFYTDVAKQIEPGKRYTISFVDKTSGTQIVARTVTARDGGHKPGGPGSC